MPKYSRIIELGSAQALHERQARRLAEAAAACGLVVTITVENHAPLDTTNTPALVALNVAKGDNATISVLAESRDTGISILGTVAAIIAGDEDGPTGPDTNWSTHCQTPLASLT